MLMVPSDMAADHGLLTTGQQCSWKGTESVVEEWPALPAHAGEMHTTAN
jgi:hypothetical protein